jgi:hypothetical protein
MKDAEQEGDMSAEFTPAPWKIGAPYGRYGVHIEGSKGENIGHVQTDMPARSPNTSYGETEEIPCGLANARLIAKAPEMYKLLRGMLRGEAGSDEYYNKVRALLAEIEGGE